MIYPRHLRELIIKPVLKMMELYSPAAVNLVLGTACVESDCGKYLKQLDGGPALGIYQMEQVTHRSLWVDVLEYNDHLADLINDYLVSSFYDYEDEETENIDSTFKELSGNMYYATAMCRLQYMRFEEPLPHPNDIEGLAKYWKKYYNTEAGKGTIEDFIEKYEWSMMK
ncbi:hypothetical protein N9937_01805 [bacterium]|nr:hypothetical protein [bacterium]